MNYMFCMEVNPPLTQLIGWLSTKREQQSDWLAYAAAAKLPTDRSNNVKLGHCNDKTMVSNYVLKSNSLDNKQLYVLFTWQKQLHVFTVFVFNEQN